MAHFEETYLPGLFEMSDSQLLAWRRSVDDTFTIVQSDADEDETRLLLDNFHPCIRFTTESENNSTIEFLDVLVKRRE